ncbi:MAG: MFS transporter [Caldilinea sp.]|nr:MFS transporter [Caldilinea sp.]MDW8442033.1 MFS transporter [Caldilineaceae bacterium]
MAKQRKQYPEDFKTMFGVSVMGLAQVVATGLIAGTLMLYITDYSGLYAGVAGRAAQVAAMMLLVGRIWDAINDPLLGFVMDRSPRTRWGRYKPFIFLSIPISAVLVIALFNIPADISDTMKVILIVVLYFAFDTVFTLQPFNSLIQTLTRDANVRAKLLIAPRVVSLLFAIALTFFLPVAIALGPDGVTPNIGLAVILFVAPVTLLSMIGVALVKEGSHSVDEETVTSKDFLAMFKQNRPLFISLLVLLFGGFLFNLTQVASVYYIKYAFGVENLGRNTAMLGIVSIFSIIASAFLSKLLLKRFTPGICVMLAYGTASVVLAVLWLLNLGGPISNMAIFLPLLALFYLGNSTAFIPNQIINMECMDYNRYILGKSLQGTTNAMAGFIAKLQAALGSALVGLVLAAVGYDARLYETATNIPTSLFSGLGIVYFALPALFGFVAVGVMCFYPLLRKSQRDKVYAEIEQRDPTAPRSSVSSPEVSDEPAMAI